MPTRNVMLTDHQSALLDRLVESGRYQNASEAMRAGLRMVEDAERDRERLSAYIDELVNDPKSHEVIERPGEEVIADAFEAAKQRYKAKNPDVA